MKIVIMLSVLLAIATISVNESKSYTISTGAPYAAIMDCNSDTIIFERNLDERMFPSSMSKLMTLYVIFSKIKSGAIHTTDVYQVSNEAEEIGGSTMFLKSEQKVTVKDLINGVIVASGNDASIVLAEGSTGTQRDFINEMNDMGQRLGMTNSHFANVTGWPDPEHYITPRDLLILAKALFQDFPEYFNLFKQKEITFNQIKQKNRNSLLWSNAEVNGIKTGYTNSGGYGIIASAKLDGRLVFVVVNGLRSEESRHKETRKLLDYAFSNFESKLLFKKGEPIHYANVWMGKEKKVPIVAIEDVNIVYDKNVKSQIKVSVKYQDPIFVPILKNQKLGEISVSIPGIATKTVALLALEDVEVLSSFGQFIRNVSNIFGFN